MSGQTTLGTPSRRAVAVLSREFSIGGFGYGLRQEFLKAVVAARIPPDVDWSVVDAALSEVIPQSVNEQVSGIADRIIHWTAELQRAGAQPVFDRGRVVGIHTESATMALALPTLTVAAANDALSIVVGLLADLLDGVVPVPDVVREARVTVDAFIGRYEITRSGGSNTPHFLRAAHDSKLPWTRVAGEVFQIGMGSRARWIDSSLTDVTPAISLRLARDKLAAADVLRQAGLPVPRHQLVKSDDEAAAAAARLGYPVVVKPADRDGGIAVAAGLKDEAGVRLAYAAARAASPNVLVEKHVEGRDYRLVVHNGRVIWALERVPGGVTGDGASTVAELLDTLNREATRAKRADSPLKPLVLDREALELLAEGGLSLQSVPAAGERVRLRRAANIASGGTPEAVFDRVHPDNRRLSERAAAALRLDIAGIDLLIPDISRSWKETGAAICEVNAQPTIGSTTAKHLYGEVLRSLLDGDGRIPIAMILGVAADSPVPALVARILSAAGLRTVIADQARGDEIARDSANGVFGTARRALMDRDTDALVVAISDQSVLRSGVPFDRCTTVVLAGTRFEGQSMDPEIYKAFGRLLLPSSLRSVVIDARAAAWRNFMGLVNNARVVLSGAGAEAAVRDHVEAGHDAVIVDRSGGGYRLVVGREVIDLVDRASGDGPRIACTPDDVALAAAAAWTMGYGAEIIRRGLVGIRLDTADAAA